MNLKYESFSDPNIGKIIPILMYISRRVFIESNKDWNLYKKRMEETIKPMMIKSGHTEKLIDFYNIFFLIGLGNESLDQFLKGKAHWEYSG